MLYTYFYSYKSRIIIELKRDHLYPLYVEEMVFFCSLRYNNIMSIFYYFVQVYTDKKEGHYGVFLETNYLFNLYYTDWWGNNNYRGSIIPTVISYRVRPT